MLFVGPIKRRVQKVTQFYNNHHGGLDLRCYNFLNWKKQPFVATEDSVVLRIHRDKKDNGIVVLEPLWSGYKELKYIHVNIDKLNIDIGQFISVGDIIGYSEIRGQSKSHHLHFETWKKEKINPVFYFTKHKIKYK